MKKLFFSAMLALSLLLTSCASAQTSSTSYSGTQISTTKPTQTSATSGTTSPQAQERSYILTKDDDNYYIHLIGNFSRFPDGAYHSDNIEFYSFADMIYRIKAHDLTEHELDLLYNAFPKDENGIKICNLDKLYLPSPSFSVEMNPTLLSPSGYAILFFEETTRASGNFAYFNEEYDFNQKLSMYTDWADTPLITIINVATEEERNATVTHYKNSVAEFKKIDYTITDGSKTLYIQEEYVLKSAFGASETVPKRITILGTENGEYFEISMSNLQSRPSYEWIKSVGITEYVE